MAGVKKQDDTESSRSKLRAEAEKKVARSADKSAPLKKQALDKLVHELRVHQVELEMQNEELRGAQEQIAKSRNDYADLYDFSPVGYLTLSGDALITGMNLTGAALLGVERQKLLKRRFRQFVAPADAELWDRHFVSVLQQGEKQSCDLLLRRNDGSTLHARLDSIRVEMDDGTVEVRTGMSDITIQKQAEEKLRESEERFRVAQEMSPDGFTILHSLRNEKGEIIDFTWVYENKTIARINGTDPEVVKGKRLLDLFPTHKGTPAFEAYIYACNAGKTHIIEELYVGEIVSRPTWLRLVIVSTGEDIAILAQDISERKRAEHALKESEQLYRSLFDNMLNGFAYCRMIFENGLPRDWIYLTVNSAFEKQTGLKDVVGKKITEIFPGIYEADPDLFETYGRVALSGIPETIEIYSLSLGQWLSISLYSPQKEYFVAVFDVVTERKQSEEKLLKSHESLKKALNDAINTIVKIVETRDPYTAGHQHKVADLAVAIAMEMQFDDIQIDQLKTAAVIHDIGKMYVPTDILSKPGKLSDMELSLIKTHAQAGFDIVKGMDFPGAVAETVLQHHERLDGSGYPNHLKSEDTLLEAKILAVADVVEAMASHRPYRPALGIDKALEEISKNRGKLYDPGVVDTCLALFNSGRFEFKSA